ncbi:MAG: TlpA family protein disulfide reductase [Acidimicrobiia bacterium]
MLVVGFALTWALGGDTVTATEGDAAPDFTVELLDGGSFSLADHLTNDGRPLILNLWASWCPPCRKEIPDLSAFAAANPDVAVIGVAVEDVLADSRALAVELDPSYPLAFGDEDFANAYPNLGLPVTYFIDGDGTVTEVFNGVLTEATIAEKVD